MEFAVLTATPIRHHDLPNPSCPHCAKVDSDYQNLQKLNEQLGKLVDDYRRKYESAVSELAELREQVLPQAA